MGGITVAWEWILARPGPEIFCLSLAAIAFGISITNGIQEWWLRRGREQHLVEMETKLPTLKAEVFITRQKLPVRQTVLIHQGSFVLLRIRNEPVSHSSLAIADNLYAKISYYDEQWRELFPPTQGIWYSSESSTSDHVESLRPQHIAHLYLSIKMPWEKSGAHFAPDALYLHNIKPDRREHVHQLTNPKTYVKVVLTCHLYQVTYYYMLTNNKDKEDLDCKEILPPEEMRVSRETNSTIS